MYNHASHSPLRQLTIFLWWRLSERGHNLARVPATLHWWLWSLETPARCLFLGEQVTGQTFDWIPHTVTSEGGGIVGDFAAEPLPSVKHFLLHFEQPGARAASTDQRWEKSNTENNTRSLRFCIWRDPVSPVHHTSGSRKGFSCFSHLMSKIRATKWYILYFNLQNRA